MGTPLQFSWAEFGEQAIYGERAGRWPRGASQVRHQAASLAVSVRANVKAVQRMLGHAKASMTLDTYADLFDEDLDEVADRLNDAIRVTADALRTAQVP